MLVYLSVSVFDRRVTLRKKSGHRLPWICNNLLLLPLGVKFEELKLSAKSFVLKLRLETWCDHNRLYVWEKKRLWVEYMTFKYDIRQLCLDYASEIRRTHHLPVGIVYQFIPLPGFLNTSQVFFFFRISSKTRWWFQIFFVIFTITWGDDPIWLIYFKWVETTN